MKSRTGRAAHPLALVAIVIVVLASVCALSAWAALTVAAPAAAGPAQAGYSVADAVEGEVSAQLTLNVSASWPASPVGTNRAAGVVTSVDLVPDQLVTQGTQVYSVNLRPVVVASGDVPAFRMIGRGSRGADVSQLQEMLRSGGFFDAPTDGSAGEGTLEAVSLWQSSLGLEPTGEVSPGDVIFVPRLPARIAVRAESVFRGGTLVGGEQVLLGLGDAPQFTLPVSEAQSGAIPDSSRVEIDDGAGHTWHGIVGERMSAESGAVALSVDPAEGSGAVCGDECDVVGLVGQTLLPSRVVTVPAVTGTVVPSAALQSDAQQALSVVDELGVVHPVIVQAQAHGQSVVTGIRPGLAVRVPEVERQ
ncbi:peptidoglycan-binding domain-containing protein [Subtercola frigoramans]|uniref:Peptidoglycan hydrolase-like protein with peptidoglycan-binding domain n=1 Tax=Subtercola frigoramans TaxID=120298 RepID=A0ABS2L5P2_9MICO|nr:peptidoglycan-binding domain-containing protein [Subtercola frigoramans]MBM7472418.1 peptidoglycan hydrolase-like protein with peptidoglycan-binding domain [Subtercola frigoramans]